METEILFHSAPIFAGKVGVVEPENCKINGVSIISTGEAQGHGMMVDLETLNQIHTLGMGRKRVPVNLDHGSGIEKTCGYLENFRLDGGKVRADWQLLRNHSETPLMLERAQVMPDCFGMSCAFAGKGVPTANGQKAARADRLLSVDCVCRPATGDGGLFSAKDPEVDSNEKQQMQTPGDKEPTLKEVMDSLEAFKTEMKTDFDQLRGITDQVVDHLNGQAEEGATTDNDREILEALHNASDEELAQHGLTRQEVDAAVGEYNAGIEGGEQGQQGQEAQGEAPAGQSNGAAPVVAATPGVLTGPPTTFSAVTQRLVQLEAKLAAKERQEVLNAEAIQFAEVEGKIVTLAEQNQQLKEFAASKAAEVDALRVHVRTGTRPVKAGVDDGVRLFAADENGELHEFQKLVKQISKDQKVSEGAAIQLARKEPNGPALHSDWLQHQGAHTITA